MEYAIKILEERLEDLNYAYQKKVIGGKVSKDSIISIYNRQKASEIEAALECLRNAKKTEK